MFNFYKKHGNAYILIVCSNGISDFSKMFFPQALDKKVEFEYWLAPHIEIVKTVSHLYNINIML